MESGLFILSLSLFFKEDSPTLSCWYILNFLEFWIGSFCGMDCGVEIVIAGSITGKSGCQYPEWVTDRPDMFGLANGEFLWDEDL